MTGDGRVTLNEAYQFAFHETLAQTTSTEDGAQHPSYDIKMSGSGDVVMTDLRETTSTLVLGEGQYGRFYVLDSDRQLVAELHKPLGRRVELGARAGNVRRLRRAGRHAAHRVGHARRRREDASCTAAELRATKLLPSRRRGPEDADDLLDGRLRAQLGATVCERSQRPGGRYSVAPLEQALARLRVLLRNGTVLPAAAPTSCWERATTQPSVGASGRTAACCSAAPKWPTGSGPRRSSARAGSSLLPCRPAWTSSSAATSRSIWAPGPTSPAAGARLRDVRRRGLPVRGPQPEIARPNS